MIKHVSPLSITTQGVKEMKQTTDFVKNERKRKCDSDGDCI